MIDKSSTVQPHSKPLNKTQIFTGDTTMGMEMTACVGNMDSEVMIDKSSTVQPHSKPLHKTQIFSGNSTMGMEMTACVGNIMDSEDTTDKSSTVQPHSKPLNKTQIFSGDTTMGMEMTACVGNIMDSDADTHKSLHLPSLPCQLETKTYTESMLHIETLTSSNVRNLKAMETTTSLESEEVPSLFCKPSMQKLSFLRTKLTHKNFKTDGRPSVGISEDVTFKLPSICSVSSSHLKSEQETAALSTTRTDNTHPGNDPGSRLRFPSGQSDCTSDSIGIMQELPPEFTSALMDTYSEDSAFSEVGNKEASNHQHKDDMTRCEQEDLILQKVTVKEPEPGHQEHDVIQAGMTERTRRDNILGEEAGELPSKDNFDLQYSSGKLPKGESTVCDQTLNDRELSVKEPVPEPPDHVSLSKTLPLQPQVSVRELARPKLNATLPNMNKGGRDEHHLSDQSSLGSKASFSQNQSHLSVIENDLLEGKLCHTVDDFLKMLNIYSLSQRNLRRSTIMPVNVSVFSSSTKILTSKILRKTQLSTVLQIISANFNICNSLYVCILYI